MGLTDNLTILTSYITLPPQAFKRTKCLTSNKFSEALRGHSIKLFALYFSLFMLLLFDEFRCYNSVTYKCRDKQSEYSIVFLTFSSKCSCHIIAILRSGRHEVFCKKAVVKHFAKFIGKQLWRSPFSYKISGRVEKRFRHMFYYKINEIFKKIFFKEHLWRDDSGYETFSSNFLHIMWKFLSKIFCWSNQPLFAVCAWLS